MPTTPTVTVIVPAAGSGTRFGARKQFAEISGVPMLRRTLDVVSRVPGLSQIVVAAPADALDEVKAVAEGIVPAVDVVPGGATRAESVRNALKAVGEVELVAVHDAARPLATVALFQRTLSAALEWGAAVPGLPVTDTVRRASGHTSEGTVDRTGLWTIQTPQAFRTSLLRKACEQMTDTDGVTDDAMLVERLGEDVHIIEGELSNTKITTPEDLAWAAARVPRVGLGRDRHPLEEGRPLVLCGLTVEGAPVGPVGHSDGDVLCHAIADAILGAAAAGDLGTLFPDDADWTEGISGDRILEGAVEAADDAGLVVHSVDATIWIRKPRLAEVLPEVRQRVADALGVDIGCVNLKAKSGNDIDAVGRGEAAEGEAVVVLSWR